MEEFTELKAPPVLFPSQLDPTSAYRVAFDMLVRRQAAEALDVLAPALADDPGNPGLGPGFA